MKTEKKRTSWLITIAVFLCLFLLTGCQKKYETIEVPTVEEAQGGLNGEKETIPVTIKDADSQKKAEKSSHEASVTTESSPEFQSVEETVYVTGSNVNIRTQPSTSGEIVGRLKAGTALVRNGYSKSFSRVIYEDKECYVSSQYLSVDKPAPKQSQSSVVSGSGSGKLIAIDPGHQAKGNSQKEPIGPGSSQMKAKVASGTQGTATGIPEYKLTLAVSLKLKQELLDRGYQVYMIRETNEVDISNAERAKMANESGADLFIRVHANSLNDSSVAGALTMCQTAKNPYNSSLYEKSAALSKTVVNGISSQTGFKNRGVQETDTMSGINWCQIPVTIVEMGFMSNPDEDKKMATDEYRDKIAKGIADGIDAYYAGGN